MDTNVDTRVLIWTRVNKSLEHVISQSKLRGVMTLQQDREHRRCLKAIDTETGAFVGYIRFVLPQNEKSPEQWPEAIIPRVNDGEMKKADEDYQKSDWVYDTSMDVLDGPMDAKRWRLLEGREYVGEFSESLLPRLDLNVLTQLSVLDYLAVHPDNRNRGIASLLVEEGMRKIEELGYDTFVIAFEMGLHVYEKAGFELLDRIYIDDTDFGGDGHWIYYLHKTILKK